MVKVTLFTGLFLCFFLNTAALADSMDQENNIATACKPYIEQYTGNEDPDKLSPTAQKALKACSDHGSCQTSILSGIQDCAIRLNNLQPNQTPAVIVQQTPTPPPKPANPFELPIPPTEPTLSSDTTSTAAQPAVTTSSPITNAATPSNTTSPTNHSPDSKKSPTTINWF